MNSIAFDLPETRSASVPIPDWARQTALGFARQETDREKKIQVCLNTLAVCSAKEYLQNLGYITDLTSSKCWNRASRHFLDVADLNVQGKGVLECRPLSPGETSFGIPTEVAQDRIGYLAVRIDLEEPGEALIYGFSRSPWEGEKSISELEAIDELPEYLAEVSPSINLFQWFENVFEEGWLAFDQLQSYMQPAFRSPSFRSPDVLPTSTTFSDFREPDPSGDPTEVMFRGADLGQGQAVILGLKVVKRSDASLQARAQAFPCAYDEPLSSSLCQLFGEAGDSELMVPAETDREISTAGIRFFGENVALPKSLRIVLRDEAGTSLLEAQVDPNRNASPFMDFTAVEGDKFVVELVLPEETIAFLFDLKTN